MLRTVIADLATMFPPDDIIVLDADWLTVVTWYDEDENGLALPVSGTDI